MTRVWLPVLVVLAFVFSVSAQNNSQPKTVTDFYYLLPEKYFPQSDFDGSNKLSLRDYRKSIIKIEDPKNGYLRLEGTWIEGWAEVAVFKKTNGKYIVGISIVGCGPGCSNEEMAFLSYENGQWQEITGEVLPKITDAQIEAAFARHKVAEDDRGGLAYELPRLGTTIKVKLIGPEAAVKDKVFFELNWNGTKFVLKNK